MVLFLLGNFDDQQVARDTMNFYVQQGNVATQSYTLTEIPVVVSAQEFHTSYQNGDNILVKITPVEILPIEVSAEVPIEELPL